MGLLLYPDSEQEDGEADEVDPYRDHEYVIEPKNVCDIGRNQRCDKHHDLHGDRRKGKPDAPLLTGRETGCKRHASGHTQTTKEPVGNKEDARPYTLG